MTNEKPRFRAPRRFLLCAAIGIAALVLGAVAAPLIVRGPLYGHMIEHLLPATRGRIHIGGGSWSWGAVLALVRERPAQVLIEDIRIIDPEGTEVLGVQRLSAQVEIDRAARRVVIHGLRIENAHWQFAPMKHGGVGFLTAIEPAAAAPAAKPSRPSAGTLEIQGAELDGLDARFDFSDWGLVLSGVHASAWLKYSSASHGVLTWQVQDADVRGGGELRVLQPKANWRLPFSHARLDRVATPPDALDAIQIDASAVTTGRSVLALGGAFPGVYSGSKTGMELHARIDDASDMLRLIAAGQGIGWPSALHGERTQLKLAFSGPFADLRIGADASVDLPDGGRIDGDVNLGLRRLSGTMKLAFTHLNTPPLLPSPLIPILGGKLEGIVQAGFELGSAAVWLSDLDLTLARPPGVTGPRVVHLLSGTADQADRPPPDRSIWTLRLSGGRFAEGTLRVPRLGAPFAGGLVAVSGRIILWDHQHPGRLASPKLDLTVVADRLSSADLVGAGFLRGRLSFRGRVQGRLPDLAVDLAISDPTPLLIVGQRFRLPDRIRFRVDQDGLHLPTLRLGGPGDCEVTGGGRIGLDGALQLAVGLRAFPFEKLPGFAETGLPVKGRLSGQLAISGPIGRVALAGQVAIDPVTFQGRPVGGGALALSTDPAGAIHARGRLVEGIDADGSLTSTPAGLRGEATLVLQQLRLDPFLSRLPGGVSALGTLSGTIVTRIAPGQSVLAEGRLTQLTLTVKPPAAAKGRGRAARAVDLRSAGDIPFSARAGDGAVHIGPAHFTGGAGAFEIEGQHQGDHVSGTLRGRVQLEGLSPVTAAWVDHLSGAVDVDLHADTGRDGRYQLKGDVSVAAPLGFQVRALPFATRIPTGRVHFAGDSMETIGLPVNIDGAASGPIGRTEGSAIITARVGGTAAEPQIRATMDIRRLQLQLGPSGTMPIEVAAGRIDFDGRALFLSAIPIRWGDALEVTIAPSSGPRGEIDLGALEPPQLARLDLPFEGHAQGLDLQALGVPGVRIDQANFAFRLRGPRESLRLGGDVEIAGAHARSSSKDAKKKRPQKEPAEPSLRRELERTQLDVRIHSKSGAVAVNVPLIPDFHIDVDYQVGGTVKTPTSGGKVLPTGAYSAFILWLGRLL